jgi:hypothetical protein
MELYLHSPIRLHGMVLSYSTGTTLMDLREIGINGANWIRLAQDRVQWQAFVSIVMNLQVP